MVMIRPPGKSYEVAKKVLKQKGVKVPKRQEIQPAPKDTPKLSK